MLNGQMGDLIRLLPSWSVWAPKKSTQTLTQGGLFVFKGAKCVLDHFDQSTGAHADFDMVLGVAGSFNKAADACAAKPVSRPSAFPELQ